MNRPSDNDYDERGAMRRMLESEAAREGQPPSALVLSDLTGRRFWWNCPVCDERSHTTMFKAVAQRWCKAHNEATHG